MKHREGGRMGTVETLVMAACCLLVLGAVVLSIRQGAKQREQAARYSAGRGWSAPMKTDAALNALLEETAPEERWWPHSVMLAEHAGRRHDTPVTVFTRTPGLEKLMADTVEAGSGEFRRKFIVTCRDASSALAAVSADTEQILLEHDSGPGWNLTVTVGRGAVLVSSSWARSEQEGDHLVALARRLRAVVR